MRRYDIITFDCYGTLIDWRAGITDAFQLIRPTLRRNAVLDAYNEIEPLVQNERYRLYHEVLVETAIRVADRLGSSITRLEAAALPESVATWEPFTDTNPALERLVAAGHTLGLLSNIDDDLLAATLKHLTVPFEFVVTAQQVRSYKPARGHFEKARSLVGERRWLHAAQSYSHDILPTAAAHIPNAWINRRAEIGGDVRPTLECRNLTQLADALTSS